MHPQVRLSEKGWGSGTPRSFAIARIHKELLQELLVLLKPYLPFDDHKVKNMDKNLFLWTEVLVGRFVIPSLVEDVVFLRKRFCSI